MKIKLPSLKFISILLFIATLYFLSCTNKSVDVDNVDQLYIKKLTETITEKYLQEGHYWNKLKAKDSNNLRFNDSSLLITYVYSENNQVDKWPNFYSLNMFKFPPKLKAIDTNNVKFLIVIMPKLIDKIESKYWHIFYKGTDLGPIIYERYTTHVIIYDKTEKKILGSKSFAARFTENEFKPRDGTTKIGLTVPNDIVIDFVWSQLDDDYREDLRKEWWRPQKIVIIVIVTIVAIMIILILMVFFKPLSEGEKLELSNCIIFKEMLTELLKEENKTLSKSKNLQTSIPDMLEALIISNYLFPYIIFNNNTFVKDDKWIFENIVEECITSPLHKLLENQKIESKKAITESIWIKNVNNEFHTIEFEFFDFNINESYNANIVYQVPTNFGGKVFVLIYSAEDLRYRETNDKEIDIEVYEVDSNLDNKHLGIKALPSTSMQHRKELIQQLFSNKNI